eukprot:TRINITY_DN574_c0_g1_i7.p1 TRINITY_DN574_c0_g1~~TRINITY_DN574_c0_g1_i7.p1  ORF type:complete len:452 (-),score=53.65 TRINITY_DN574_c0_g1_i7:116-1471(-)
MSYKNKGKQKRQQESVQAQIQSLGGYPHVHLDLFSDFLRLPRIQGFFKAENVNQPRTPEELFSVMVEHTKDEFIVEGGFDALRGPLLTHHFTETANKSFKKLEIATKTFFKYFLVNPRQTIELVIALLNYCHPSVDRNIYIHTLYMLIPLMPHLTEDDCRAILANFNCRSFYIDVESKKLAMYNAAEPQIREGDHLLLGLYQFLLPYASDIFMATYVKLLLDKSFWATPERHRMAFDTNTELLRFHAPHLTPLLMDLFTCAIVGKGLELLMDLSAFNLDNLDVFCKALPLVKLVYKEERVEHESAGHFKDLLLKNEVKPAECDKKFLVEESYKVVSYHRTIEEISQKELEHLRKEYMKELQALCAISSWKMLSDEVECNFIGCSNVKKFKELTKQQHSGDGITTSQEVDYMLRCGKCKARYYCSVECQQKSWIGGHKVLCSHIAAVSKYKL